MYLNCHSYHSLRYGTIPLKDLVQQAVANNVTALALTDINTVTGIYDFVKECQAVNIKPIVGIEFRQDNKLLYTHSTERQYDAHRQIREDVSMTQRAPYPQAHEIGLPRFKMKT